MSHLQPVAHAVRVLALLCTSCAALPLLAQTPNNPTTSSDTTLPTVNVTSTRVDLQGQASTASEGIVTSKQLSTRPLLRAGDVMEAVPGLVATQHAGEGKANQYFLRGFNLDHGTDFATFVDGMPINLPTHGHGQGYTDLYFLIPELIDSVQYRKGPYYAEEGDFASSGAARLRTLRKLDAPLGVIQLGADSYRRFMAAGSFTAGAGDLLLAAEDVHDDGPWDIKQNHRKNNFVAKYSQGTDNQGFSLGLTHYRASWTSTDQVPERAIASGLIGRFGSLDPTAGGRTERTALQGEWALSNATGGVSRLNAWAMRYRFDLFSNFSYATRGCDSDPLPAVCDSSTLLDQFEQVDRRKAFGLTASHTQPTTWLGRDVVWSLGSDLRRDNIGEVGLYDTQERARLATVRSDSVRVEALGLWGQLDVQLAEQWRTTLGLRHDRHRLNVSSSVADNSGRASASITSPKASLIYTANERLDLYANWGRGFHSNDARGATIRVDPRDGVTPVDSATPLVRATGYEIGARQKWSEGLSTTASLWALKLDSELLFVGDAGTTEASRPSKRTGIELTAHWHPSPRWDVDADLSLSKPRFADSDPTGDRIPGAMERVFTLGANYQTGAWTFGARLRHFGSRALLEDNSIRAASSTLVNTRVAYQLSRQIELSLDVFNLFDRKANDIEYAYASRLPGEPAFQDGVTPNTRHLHPSVPRTLRVGMRVEF
jgi:outer membrane receptor protein involved in Fe transport